MKAPKLTLGMLFAGVFVFGIALQTFGQKILPEITVTASNYKYLNAVNPEVQAQPVNMLQQYAAAYNVKGAEFYEEEYDNYFVSFYIPEGKILAAYDKDGTLLRTAEKYKDVALPKHVRDAVTKRFPQWNISTDAYLVSYYSKENVTKKVYKLVLQNGDQRLRIKVNDNAEFL